MALTGRKNRQLREELNTGFGNNPSNMGNRLVNRDGTPNVRRTGIFFYEKFSWYHTMIRMSWWKFLFFVFIVFLLVNGVFAAIYIAIGAENLNGITARKGMDALWQVYFFSIQTFTTVGYGHISPVGWATSAVAAFQAFCGLMSFALATGLLYGRFSRPRAYLRFSERAIITPYKEATALMFRMVPQINNQLTEAEVKLNLMMRTMQDDKPVSRFYSLKTEIDRINSLVLSWTVVHPINEESPLYGLTEADITSAQAELLVFVRAFDESFSNTVVSRTSYRYDEWAFGVKFIPMYHASETGLATILEMDKLNETIPAPLPEPIPLPAQ
ncbi:MAG: transporter [Dinghuibacter sp.]|nr:transporter [Dinghuibacter sp.]